MLFSYKVFDFHVSELSYFIFDQEIRRIPMNLDIWPNPHSPTMKIRKI